MRSGHLTCDRIEDTVLAHNVNLPVAVFWQIAIESDTLPKNFYGNLACRKIISTSRGPNEILVPHDRDIIRYAEAVHVSVLAA